MTRALALSSKRSRIRLALFGLIAATIYIGNLRWVVPSDLSPEFIAASVAIDLVAWVPLLYYFIVQRCGAGPAYVTRMLVAAGVLVTLATVPDSEILRQMRATYPLLAAAAAIAATVFLVVKASAAWPRTRGMTAEQRIHSLVSELFGESGLARVIRSEWVCAYYALFGWKQAERADQQVRFSYDRRSGAVGTLLGMSALHVPGLFFWHLIVMHAWPGIALLFTVLHVYTMVFTVGQAMAMRHRFMVLSGEGLLLRCGLFFENRIDYDAIERVERATWSDLERAPGRLRATLGADVNVKIVFRNPQRLDVAAGLSKSCKELVLGVDAPERFIAALRVR